MIRKFSNDPWLDRNLALEQLRKNLKEKKDKLARIDSIEEEFK